MNMNIRALIASSALLLMAGCATQPGSCDSNNVEASLITKMNCDHSGGYSDQVRQREQALTAARAENASFRDVYDALQAQQKSTSKSLAEQQKQQAALDGSMSKLLSQLKARHANKAQAQQQIADLEKQMAAKKQVTASTDPAVIEARKQELKALQQKVSRLQLSLGYE
ncbi:putative Lipoprotein [Pseudomonas syringae pv. primulae]|uniref:Putative Lipoprotein n=2 Tax=Pseudomonas syringae group genomosp. 3 TaxID=251701 RepID=A0A3M3XIM0_9PSED|nr:putative Lipoprotein [Pseudomonas syringae pv. primulae]RMU40327.1 putative Lipoprotein [Pseudomonas syringae pv. primulae]